MPKIVIRSTLLLFLLSVPGIGLRGQSEKPPIEDKYKQGHSRHGAAFDAGPREKPWEMEGIGKVHFPITTSNPEVQKWFNQGHALLHSFWYYEAERAFRWCLKLDPECAMAYWGLARSVDDRKRSAPLIKEAARRKDKVSERERLYIEAWEALYGPGEPRDPAATGESNPSNRDRFRERLEKLTLRFPEDIEARSLLALDHLGNNRLGADLILKQVIAQDPRHPGAHHYRIHNWDRSEGEQALDSCRLYGEIAPMIGHAQHMPGHIYSGLGMWHEGAISMDSATRVEQQYMRRRMIFPFNDWNYAHNRNYLCYIQEQLGMPTAATSGARQLLAAPRDPQHDNPDEYGTHWQGMIALMRVLIKFERWKEILEPKAFPWRDNVRDKTHRAYCEALAHLGLGDRDKAMRSYDDHAALYKDVQKPENKWLDQTYGIQSLEIRAKLALASGDDLTGLGLLADAAKREFEQRHRANDPPSYPVPLYNALGRAYADRKSPILAIKAFEKTLELVRNDAFALAGLAQAYAALGETEKARDAYARLLYVWSDGEPGLPWMEGARKLGLDAKPRDSSPGKQRNYKLTTLDPLGPNQWQPYDAPRLDALDAKGKRVTLEEYRGRNLLLIFYLGEECPHCMEQLVEVTKRKDELSRLNTDVLAISSDTPQQNAASSKVSELPFRLLSDGRFENARRFKSYDDYEDLALHSTILIDGQGRVHWSRNGGDPFKDFDFLMKEIQRLSDDAPGKKKPDSTKTATK